MSYGFMSNLINRKAKIRSIIVKIVLVLALAGIVYLGMSLRNTHFFNRDPNPGVYTEVTRLAYRDFKNLPDSRYEEDVITYKNKAYEVDSEDFATVMQLGKLYAITSLSPKKRMSFLKKAKQLNPDSPEPYKYLGIVHLDAFYQFESAINPRRTGYRRKAVEMFEAASDSADPRRVKWLKRYLFRKGILD